MHCANCGVVLGKLEDARAWGGRPACNRCFKRLSADRPKTGRRFWKPLAIGFGVVAVVQGVAIAALLSHSAREAAMSRAATEQQAAASRSTPARAVEPAMPASADTRPLTAGRASPDNAVAPASEIDAGPSRSDILAMFRVDRPWYWHYEQSNRDNPFRFAENQAGEIRTVGEGGDRVMLERRWVVSVGGHHFLPFGSRTLRGFHESSGRQVGAFTD